MQNIKSGSIMKTRLTKAAVLLWATFVLVSGSVGSVFLCNYYLAIR